MSQDGIFYFRIQIFAVVFSRILESTSRVRKSVFLKERLVHYNILPWRSVQVVKYTGYGCAFVI